MGQCAPRTVPLTGTLVLLRLLRGPSAFANSTRVWLVLVAFLGMVNVFITFVGAGLERDPRSVLFSWPAIAVVGLVGLGGIWLSHRTGFPAAWDERVSNQQRLVVPAVLGISLGLLSSALDLVFHWTQFFAQFSGLPAFNAPWPGSLLLLHGRRNPGRGVLSTAAGAAAGVARLELAATRSRPGAGLLDPAGPTVPVASVQPAVYPFNSAELLRLERYRAAIRAGLYNDWPIDSSVERLHSISDVIHALELD